MVTVNDSSPDRSIPSTPESERLDTRATADYALRGRIGAFRLHATHDPKLTTANARRAFLDRFLAEVDPDGVLPEPERERRAEMAKRAYFTRLARRSAAARAATKKPGRQARGEAPP